MSSFMPRWKRVLKKCLPFLFNKCPHGNYGWRWNYVCYCMISGSDDSVWSFAIALRIKNKWISVQEQVEIICWSCNKKSHVSKSNTILHCWSCKVRIDGNRHYKEPKQIEILS